MEDKKTRACVYVRVSTDKQVQNGYSVGEQERRCKALIESKGWEYTGTYRDLGASGRNIKRKGLRTMLEDIAFGQIDVVVVYALDRLSQRQRDTLYLLEDVFPQHNVEIVSLTESLDTTTPLGRAMIGILAAFNQMEEENMSTNLQMGRKAKAEKGGYAGGKPPYGYKVVDGKLEIDPKAAEVVRLIYGLRERGLTLKAITKALNDAGYRTQNGLEFKHSAIQRALGNEEIYKGHYRYGEKFFKDHHEPII